MKNFLRRAVYLLAASCFSPAAIAQHNALIIDAAVNLVDGKSGVCSNVRPGDTVFLKAGTRDKLLVRNFTGTPDSPVVFMNLKGAVTINTNDYYGISIINCRYIRFSGQGDGNVLYGIQIKKVAAGCGIGIGNVSSDVEIDHISIENCSTEGIYAKTDPDCTLNATRDKFTQYNTSIHDNYIANIGNEGMYIGSSYYAGITVTCNGKDTVLMPPVLDGVKIYNNIVTNTGWDGIQVSSAPLHCFIFNNTVTYDSQAEVPNQMSGIIMGGGTKCDCNNNMVRNGKGDGIENHGLGGNSIYNNIIVNAGKTYMPGDLSRMKHGILVSDVSVMPGAAVNIFFNDIINPKSDGIRFQSIKGKHNLIASNLIINPGNYNVYQLGNTVFTGKDAYVMVPDARADVQLKNNYFCTQFTDAGVSAADYSVLAGSPLINQGYAVSVVTFDFKNHRRPVGGLYDIGAMEFDGGPDTLRHTIIDQILLSPNPVHSQFTIRYLAPATTRTLLTIYNANGGQMIQQVDNVILPGIQLLHVAADQFAAGIYFYSLLDGAIVHHGKFIKL